MDEVLIDIPEEFYSDGEGKPFETCVVCGKNLKDPGTHYVVEKAMKNYADNEYSVTVFEYAMCTDCYEEMQKGMSEESMRNLQGYYQKLIADKGGPYLSINLHEFNLKKWLSNCFFKDKPVKEMKEYQLIGQFSGDKMVLNTPPMAIGEDVMEEMSELLSTQTKGEMDRFREQFLGPPPEIEELFKGRKILLL